MTDPTAGAVVVVSAGVGADIFAFLFGAAEQIVAAVAVVSAVAAEVKVVFVAGG